MSEEVAKPGPVDNTQRDPSYAAQAGTQAPKEAPEQEVTGETEVAETGEQNTSEQTAASEADDSTAQPQKNKGVGKRIDELTKNWRDTERERDHWREMAMRAQQQAPQQPEKRQEAPAQEAAEPTLEDFDWDVQRYNRAYFDWRKGEEKRESDRIKENEARTARVQKFQESVAAFSVENPDFQAVVTNPSLAITEQMVEVITESDNPAAVAYWIGQNPQEALKIAQMSPAAMGRAIAKIEAQVGAPPQVERQPTQKTVTNAPPPPTVLSGSKVPVKKLDEMSMAEYAHHRAEERKAKGLRP